MIKNILIAGKDLPGSTSFADSLSMAGFCVTVTGSADDTNLSSPEVKIAQWNKGSALSARSLLLQTEAFHGFTDTYILYFDAPLFAEQFPLLSQENCAEANDTMILGFQYLTLEIISRIKQRKEKSRIIFILKSHPTLSETVHGGILKKNAENPANAFVGAAEAAFATFAENISAEYEQDEFISTLLITGDLQNETMQKDSELASWITQYLSAIDQKKDSKVTSWIKAGSKPGFSLFH